jgi:hypothetical protein
MCGSALLCGSLWWLLGKPDLLVPRILACGDITAAGFISPLS